jgi:hypothetical protein
MVGVLIVETSSFGVFFEHEAMNSAIITAAAAFPAVRRLFGGRLRAGITDGFFIFSFSNFLSEILQ